MSAERDEWWSLWTRVHQHEASPEELHRLNKEFDCLKSDLSRLAAKAQCYEAAVADNAAWHAAANEAAAMLDLMHPARIPLLTACRDGHPGAALLKEKQGQEATITALADALEKALERYSRREQGSDEYRTARAALRRAGRLP